MGMSAKIHRISGPVVVAEGLNAKMYELVKVGERKLMGEVIQINGSRSTIQVYEETTGVRPGEPVEGTGAALSVELGPGLLSQIYDGVQRPLPVLAEAAGDFITTGLTAPALDRNKKWEFVATAKKGQDVSGGEIIGTVQETKNIQIKIVVPPEVKGKIKSIESGKFTVVDAIGELEDGTKLFLSHKWPVRKPRPYKEKLLPTIPMISGQRVFDMFFPIAKGGTAAIPGPFGAGKTVAQQQLAKWSDAQIVVYIGCGERGNEMTEVLTEFPHLIDPYSGAPLMERTVLIANTSNMPVAAREASVYTGMTIAEYFRDQGFDVALMADSTSRWAEAMREISSRLEEMPGEEGYPAYLGARLSEFYERAGRIVTFNNANGSVTAIGAVSPPGGDFSEPVTQNTLKITKVFWALDAKLAQRRHFPSINWLDSYSLYKNTLNQWYVENVAGEWGDLRDKAMSILQQEASLQEIVQLVGSDALPEKERVVLETARLIREGFLQQSAFHPVDSYCSLNKQYQLLRMILKFGDLASEAVETGASVAAISSMEIKSRIAKATLIEEKVFDAEIKKIEEQMVQEFEKLVAK
ncbi:V-type ATP synthase subunit A [archaeon]|nr:MAG: V-type ATP synthase subunit A [archaeon]